MAFAFVFVSVTFGVLLIIAVLSGHDMAKAGVVEGRRAALKEAIELTRERQDVSLYMAPEGELTLALVRARAVHDVEMELRRLLSEVRS